MQSCAWMNGQYLLLGPPSQSSQAAIQLTPDTMRNQQAGTADNVYQYRTANTGVRPPQSVNLIFRNGASNTQTSNGQTSVVPQQSVSSQQPAGGKHNGYLLKVLSDNLQICSSNTQSGNSHSPVIYGFQVATPQNHQNSAQNSSTQSPFDMMKANTTYIQQDMSANCNQSIQVYGKQYSIQNGNVSELQHSRVQRKLHQNVNGESTNPILAFITTATSLPPAQAVHNSTLVSATAHNIQNAPNQHHRPNSTQHGFPPSIPSTTYNVAVSQSYRNSNITTNSPSSGRSLHFSSMSQKTQQYSMQLNSAPNNDEAVTSSIRPNSNSHNPCQYEVKCFLSKTNELPLNPAANTQQQMLSHQMSARFADSQCKSTTTGSDGRPPVYTSSLHNGKQFDSKGRMMESNPTMAPVPSYVTEHYNSNASQSLLLHSGQSSPKTTQNFISAKQHIVDELPQLMQQPESISPQRNKTHSSVANNHEMLEMLTSINPNDSSIHSSPARTGPRAIAVVQPLAQECYQVASKHMSSKMINQEHERTTTDESLSNPEKFFIPQYVAKNETAAYLREVSNPLKDDCRLPPRNPNQVRSNKSAIRHSAASNEGAVVSSSDSAGPQHSQKQLCADKTGSELAIIMQLHQIVAQAAPQSVTSEVPESQNGDKDKSEMPRDANACVSELSSLPTTPWTVKAIRMLLETEMRQMKSDVFPEFNTARKLLSMFWDGSCKTLADKLRTGWYKDLITDVQEFCGKHLTFDSVILSQVRHGFREQLKSFHVIADNEVYSEMPFTSSWLNTNEQLDDIDKEFGFPWSLKHRPHTLDSDSQPDQVKKVNRVLAQISSEVQNEASSQTELEPVDSDEEKLSTIEVTSTQTASPNKTESADSSDPYYSFKVQVLSPEEAKVIFEQAQNKMTQSTETVCQPEKVTNSPVEDELPEVIDVTINESKLENGAVTPLEQICCIAKWKQIIFGSNMPSSSTCQCKKEQSHKDCTDKTLDEEEMLTQKNDKLFAIRPDSNAMEGEKQANIVNQIQTFSWPELCSEVSQTIDLTDCDKPYSYSDKDPNNTSLLSLNSSQSSIIFVSENKDENLSSSENEITNPMPDLEENCEQAHLRPTESSQSTGSHNSEKVLSSESEVATQITTNLVEDYGQAQLTSPDVAESPLKAERQTPTEGQTQTFSLKHETVDPGSQQLLQDDSKRRKVFVDATDSEPLASKVRTVELVLFGSASQEKSILVDGHKSHTSFPHAVPVPRPPEVLSVSLRPFKRKPSETVPTGEYSVKRWIHEKWRKSFPPTRIKYKSKLKTQKSTLSEVSLKKAERSGLTNTEELPVSSEMRILNGNAKRCLSLKRRRSISYGLKCGEKKTKKDAVTLKQPAVHERRKVENESQAVEPLQENNVLGFSLLPSNFSFKDTSNGIKDTTGHVSDKADLVEANDKSSNITVKSARGTWYPKPEKCIPLHPSPIPKTSSVFHEYRKKYTEKIQTYK